MCATRADKLARFHRTECWWTIKSDHFLPARKRQEREHSDQKICVQGHIRDLWRFSLSRTPGKCWFNAMPYRMREVAAVYTSVVPKGEKHASNNNNATTVVKPGSKVSPTSGPLSPAKLKFCQPCARLERGTAAINASCSMKYNTKPIATAPRIAIGILRCGFFTSPASIRPFWKPVNANATPPTESAEKICCQSV